MLGAAKGFSRCRHAMAGIALRRYSSIHEPLNRDMTLQQKLDELRRRSAEVEKGGGHERSARQESAGKLSARARLQILFDEGAFEELDKLVEHRSLDFGL
jgi:acetyl-CoA carboxylase carboxyltransferase component